MGGGVPMAYAGVAGNAALYTQGVPTGRGMFHVKHVCLAIDGHGGYRFGIFGALAGSCFGT
jgi:hypothetical protein